MESHLVNSFKDTRFLTRTEDTEDKYTLRAESLFRRVQKIMDLPHLPDPRQVAVWLKRKQPSIAKSTFTFYKSSLMFYLIYRLNTPPARQACQYINRLSRRQSLSKGTHTSSFKAKHINEEKYNKIMAVLQKNTSRYDKYLIVWLQTGLLCGLRPSEWRNSYLEEVNGEVYLHVKNGKNSNGRANGAYRTLVLTDLTQTQINLVKQQLFNMKIHAFSQGSYDFFHHACASRLGDINTYLFGKKGKRITLYSARHQFSANAKASNLSSAEIAALMGHISDETASIHYGRKRFGNRGGIKVRPIAQQVQTVRVNEKQFKSYTEYLQSKAMEQKQQEVHITPHQPTHHLKMGR